ncbi:GPI mannosyltransferase 3 [Termitomyces sp. J132]|nr:GPI mannosyltransferase 3 [Termitomyces sp. J132]
MTTTRLALVVRILIAISTRTFFQPDEYFQSLEPAYHAVFGYGYLSWEWLGPNPIRSIFYPALNIPIYWTLRVSGLSEIYSIYSPRILHGALAAATDVWICEIVRRWLGSRYESLFLSLTCFFHALSLSRSLSNSLETSLTTIAFAYYPWDASSSMSLQLIYNSARMRNVILLSALACMVRPTNAVIWFYLFGKLFWILRSSQRASIALFKQVTAIGALTFCSLFLLDSLYYQKPTSTPFNFLLTNLSSVSLFYGSNVWHYYLTQALPILCTTALPFVLHGMWLVVFDKHAVALRNMLYCVLWSICIYSFAGHKEWRFIHPILPLLHVFAARSLVDISDHATKQKTKAAAKNLAQNVSFLTQLAQYLPPVRRRFLSFLCLTIPVSVHIVLFYCSAPIGVLAYIRSLPTSELDGSIGFLMPCHSTPGHAYLHRKELAHGKMWALGCEPPLQGQDLSTYHDQTDVFFASPVEYLQTRFPSHVDPSFPPSPFPTSIPGAPHTNDYPWIHEWPRHLVFFGALLEHEEVRNMLEAKGYREVWKRGKMWEGEGRRKGGVRVWRWSG